MLGVTVAAWGSVGAFGAYLLRYPGDGLNATYLLGAIAGPAALMVAALERVFPD